MANSRQRRKHKRAQQRAIRELLWFILEHPLLASGVGAMLVTGIAIQIGGWQILAAIFYLVALLLLIVVFVRAKFFRVSSKKAWGIVGLTAVFLTTLWVMLRPPHQQPELIATVRQISLMKGKLHPDNTVIFLWVTMVNKGTQPSIAKEWSLTADIPQRGKTRLVPNHYTGPYEYEAGGVIMKMDIARENLADKSVRQPIGANGGVVAGILSFVLFDVDVEDLPKTGFPMLLLYKDVNETLYSIGIDTKMMVKGGPVYHVPGIGPAEVVAPISPSPTPSKSQK